MTNQQNSKSPFSGWLLYLLTGIIFGIILIKSEVASWYRIQEMFRFDSIHMYGVFGSAILIGMTGIQLIKRYHIKSLQGEEIFIKPKPPGSARYWLGGIAFGLGWALTGACPGPMYALLGAGYTVIIIPILAAIAGAFTYGALSKHLPH